MAFFTVFLNGSVIAVELEKIFSTTIYSEQTSDIENVFLSKFSSFDENIVYSIVPQGLIVSVDSGFFFNGKQTELSDCGKLFLSVFVELVKQIPNSFVIEVNSEGTNCLDSIENWELTTIQAKEIEKYLIKDLNANPNKIRSIGFGEINPILPKINNYPNRVDFVILNYENTR